MNEEALHTEIVERKTVGDIEIIREKYYQYTKGKSNIYAKNIEGEIIWYAELPIPEDIYSNAIQWDKEISQNRNNSNNFLSASKCSFVASSWNCYTVSIDYKNGKIIHVEFTK